MILHPTTFRIMKMTVMVSFLPLGNQNKLFKHTTLLKALHWQKYSPPTSFKQSASKAILSNKHVTLQFLTSLVLQPSSAESKIRLPTSQDCYSKKSILLFIHGWILFAVGVKCYTVTCRPLYTFYDSFFSYLRRPDRQL